MSWVLPGSAAETHSGMPEGPVRAWTRPAWWCAFPRVPFVYFCALLAGFLVGAAVGGDEGAVEDQVGKSLLSDFLQGVVQGGGQCPEDFDALVLVPVGGGLRDPEALAEAGETRPVAEPGEDEDGLLVAGQGAGSVPGAEFLPAFPQEVRNLDHELERDVKSDTIGDHAEPSQGRERCLRLMHLARRGSARPGPWRWLRRWRAFRVRSRLTASMTPRRGGIAAS